MNEFRYCGRNLYLYMKMGMFMHNHLSWMMDEHPCYIGFIFEDAYCIVVRLE